MNKDRAGIIKIVSAILYDKALYNLTNETTVTIISGEIADGILAIKPELEMMICGYNKQCKNKKSGNSHCELHPRNAECRNRCIGDCCCIPYVPEAVKPDVEFMCGNYARLKDYPFKSYHWNKHLKNIDCDGYACSSCIEPAVELPEELDINSNQLTHINMTAKINELCREIRYLKAGKGKGVRGGTIRT